MAFGRAILAQFDRIEREIADVDFEDRLSRGLLDEFMGALDGSITWLSKMHKVSARHSERISTLLEAARTKRTELVDFYIQMPRDYIIGDLGRVDRASVIIVLGCADASQTKARVRMAAAVLEALGNPMDATRVFSPDTPHPGSANDPKTGFLAATDGKVQWTRALHRDLASADTAATQLLTSDDDSAAPGGSGAGEDEDATPVPMLSLGGKVTATVDETDGAVFAGGDDEDSPLLLLCGGGWNLCSTEAEFMSARFQYPHVLVEPDSMDTIGNACFAKLLLKREDRLRPGMSVVVVTNDYHVLRTRQIFKRVFGADYYIDTVAVPTEGDPSRLQALALNELKSDARASREIFALQDHFTGDFVDIPLGDHESIIMNLFSMHDLYKFRFDLLRKYHSELAWTLTSSEAAQLTGGTAEGAVAASSTA